MARYPQSDPAAARARLLRLLDIDLVVDVGANTGMYGLELRRHGYAGRILSLEPVTEVFQVLHARARRDAAWDALPLAAGPREGRVRLNVAGNDAASSSVLTMLPAHLDAAPESRIIGTQESEQRTLDSLVGEYVRPRDRVFCKLDVQGYEGQVLQGASELLRTCRGVQLEMSLVPLYEGSLCIDEAMSLMKAAGLTLARLEPGFSNPATGRMLQADGVFLRDGP